ncbi:MAG: 4'-phosphopantetheinyl transferase family protein [Christensenellales bacterium]
MKNIKLDPIWIFLCHKNDPIPASERILCCAQVYGAALGMQLPGQLKITRPDNKKPYFENALFLHFSVSHSDGLWILALSTLPVGIDAQHHRACDKKGIASRFFHPKEQALLENDQYTSFFRIWTAKESYVKYTGAGITDDYASFSVADTARLSVSLGNAIFSFLPGGDHFTLCLCSESVGTIFLKDTRF